MKRRGTALAVVVIFLVASCASGDGGTSSSSSPTDAASSVVELPEAFTAILVSAIGPVSAPVKGSDGKWHVVYELQFTNAKAVPATLTSVTVVDGRDTSRQIQSFSGASLVDSLRALSTAPVEDASLAPSEARLMLISLVFESESDVPPVLAHELKADAAAGPGAKSPSPVQYLVAPFDIGSKSAPVLAPPLEGDGWVVLNGCCSAGGAHRDAIQSVNGQLFDSQRFAIDWMQINNDGELFTGDPSKVESWVGYGAKILAVADGKVIAVENDVPDLQPGELPDPNSITLQTVDGNHAVIDHGDGLYTFYAHMQSGSVKVEVGDQVSAGDVIGLLGNTGNTSAPHMHFHIMTGPSPLGSDGIPFVFDSFVLQGASTVAARDDALDGDGTLPKSQDWTNEQRTNELPLDVTIVGFGVN